MQFSSTIIGAALAAIVLAAPAPRDAPDGILNIYSDGGCVQGTECSRDFLVRSVDGCTVIPTGCNAGLKVLALNNNCTLAIYTDAACTSLNAITVDNTSAGTCENPSATLGIGSLLVLCTV